VRPGEAILGNIGFGFSLNPRFSFSLGYSHSYIMPTMTYIGSGPEYSTGQQIGTLDLGMSYRLNSKTSVNLNFQFGVTPMRPTSTQPCAFLQHLRMNGQERFTMW
jgi:outer membrane receptor for Fe3+-dicitrate